MKNIWSVITHVCAIIFSIAFILSAVLSLLLTSIDRRLLSPSIYKNVLVQQQFYNRLPGVLAEQLAMVLKSSNPTNSQNPSGGGPPISLPNLSVANWASILTSLAPPDVLRSETEGVIDQIFAYLNGQRDTVSLDLTPLKSRLASPVGQDAILSLIRTQPACSLQEIAQIMLNAFGGQEISICSPPDSLLNQVTPIIQAAITQIAAQLPNEVVILSPNSIQGTTQGNVSANRPATTVRNARLIMRLSSDLPLGFLLLISVLVVRTPKNWLRWWGIPLCITGMLAAVGVLVLKSSFERIWTLDIAPFIPSNVAAGLIGLGHDLLRAVYQSWLDGLLLTCIFYFLLGLAMSIGSIFIRDGHTADLSPNSPQAAV